jgi:hypothetical protein
MSSTDGGATFSSPKIVSDDRRVLQGCPALGPSLSVDSGGKLKVLWFAAGEGNPPGLYFAESSDKGNSFSPRQLLSQEAVRGTPLNTANDVAIGIWQTVAGETKMTELGQHGMPITIAANAELPAGAFSNGKMFVAYIAKEKEKRSIRLVKAG